MLSREKKVKNMQKLKKGPDGNVGALRADAMQSAGARADGKASAQTMALSSRRILSERWLCARLEPCTLRMGENRFSVLDMLEQKAEGATAADASALTLGQAVRMLMGDALVKISLHAYSKGMNGTRTSAADLLEGYVLANPNYWDVGKENRKPAETTPHRPLNPEACKGWDLCEGVI